MQMNAVNIPPRDGKTSNGARRWISAVIALFVIASSIAVFFTFHRIDTFEASHASALNAEAENAKSEIEIYLDTRRSIVRRFAETNAGLLHQLEMHPDDEGLRLRVGNILRELFPRYFTFTITDTDGNDLIDDIEGFVGEVCIRNIQEYVRDFRHVPGADAHYQTVIHPQPGHYHFDVMVPWSTEGTIKGVFFVSFFPGEIQRILLADQGPGHRLVLVHKDQPDLIEVSAAGSRDKIAMRRDIRLSDDEIALILAETPIAGSNWRIVGYVRPGLFDAFRSDVWFDTALLVFVFALSATAIVVFLAKRRRTV